MLHREPVVEEVFCACTAMMSEFTSQGLANTSWTSTTLVCANASFLAAFAPVALQMLPVMRVQELSNVT